VDAEDLACDFIVYLPLGRGLAAVSGVPGILRAAHALGICGVASIGNRNHLVSC
jgi:hypothetical protein